MAVVPSLMVWLALTTAGEFAPDEGSGYGPSFGYRWHSSDPIPFVRPFDSAIEPHVERRRATEVPVALAVFWYSEQPGPESAGP